MYEIRFSLAAPKYLKKLKEKKLKDVFKETFLEISENPYSGDEKKEIWRGCTVGISDMRKTSTELPTGLWK